MEALQQGEAVALVNGIRPGETAGMLPTAGAPLCEVLFEMSLHVRKQALYLLKEEQTPSEEHAICCCDAPVWKRAKGWCGCWKRAGPGLTARSSEHQVQTGWSQKLIHLTFSPPSSVEVSFPVALQHSSVSAALLYLPPDLWPTCPHNRVACSLGSQYPLCGLLLLLSLANIFNAT